MCDSDKARIIIQGDLVVNLIPNLVVKDDCDCCDDLGFADESDCWDDDERQCGVNCFECFTDEETDDEDEEDECDEGVFVHSIVLDKAKAWDMLYETCARNGDNRMLSLIDVISGIVFAK